MNAFKYLIIMCNIVAMQIYGALPLKRPAPSSSKFTGSSSSSASATRKSTVAAPSKAVVESSMPQTRNVFEAQTDAEDEYRNRGYNDLMISVVYNRMPEFNQYIQQKDIDVNAQTKSGQTALMIVAENPIPASQMWKPADKLRHKANRQEMALRLIAQKADVNAKDKLGRTALMFAAQEGDKELVEVLMKAGASKNDKDANKLNAWQYAKLYRHPEVATLVAPADQKKALNETDTSGMTSLIRAAFIQDDNDVTALLEEGANVNAQDVQGKTAAMYAWKSKNVNMLKSLIAKGADLTLHDKAGKSVKAMLDEEVTEKARQLKKSSGKDLLAARQEVMKSTPEGEILALWNKISVRKSIDDRAHRIGSTLSKPLESPAKK